MGKIARKVVRIAADVLTCGLAEVVWHSATNNVEEEFFEAFVKDTNAEGMDLKDFKKSLKEEKKAKAKAEAKKIPAKVIKKLDAPKLKEMVQNKQQIKEQNKAADKSAEEVKELLQKKAQQ